TASVTTSAITSSTRMPVTTQMMVQTPVEGSIWLVPDRIRNEMDDIRTEAKTTTKPRMRRARLFSRPANRRRADDESAATLSAGLSVGVTLSAIKCPNPLLLRGLFGGRNPFRFVPYGEVSGRKVKPDPIPPTLQDNCCQNVTLETGRPAGEIAPAERFQVSRPEELRSQGTNPGLSKSADAPGDDAPPAQIPAPKTRKGASAPPTHPGGSA